MTPDRTQSAPRSKRKGQGAKPGRRAGRFAPSGPGRSPGATALQGRRFRFARNRHALPWLAWLVSLQLVAGQDSPYGRQFIGLTNFTGFASSASDSTGARVFLSPEIPTRVHWNELIVSWNTESAPDRVLKIEARPVYPGRANRFYTLGIWSASATHRRRESVPGQKDSDAEVLTDVLAVARPADAAQVRLTVEGAGQGPGPDLVGGAPVKFLGLCLADSKAASPDLPPHRAAWGRSLPVPERSQLDYRGGEQSWCSPTSTSMLMAYSAGRLHRPDLDRPVPEVAAEVMDPNWPGTGNWPFNTAYAGSFSGMRAYVSRFSDVSELEDWVDAGIPVAVSVAYSRLKGLPPRPGSDGHLVVCIGFTADGDPIVNDPGSREHARRVVARANLVRAWAQSHNTVYLVYPESWPVPPDRFGHWQP